MCLFISARKTPGFSGAFRISLKFFPGFGVFKKPCQAGHQSIFPWCLSFLSTELKKKNGLDKENRFLKMKN